MKLVDIKTPKKKSLEAIVHTLKAILKAKELRADIVHIHAIGSGIIDSFGTFLGMKIVFTHHGPI